MFHVHLISQLEEGTTVRPTEKGRKDSFATKATTLRTILPTLECQRAEDMTSEYNRVADKVELAKQANNELFAS